MEIQVDYRKYENELGGIEIVSLAEFVLVHEEIVVRGEVSISFVSREDIASLNEEYRNKKGPTDVLSFECDGIDEITFYQNEGLPFELGDVVIAPDIAREQATLYGTTFEQEISLLLVHGLLHLCGYDHVIDADAEVMESLEVEILQLWGKHQEEFPEISTVSK